MYRNQLEEISAAQKAVLNNAMEAAVNAAKMAAAAMFFPSMCTAEWISLCLRMLDPRYGGVFL